MRIFPLDEIAEAAVDSPIAGENDIQQYWGVAPATARYAIAELLERGLVYTEPGRDPW